MLKLNVFQRTPRRRRPVASALSFAVAGVLFASTAFATPRTETDDFDAVESDAKFYEASYDEPFYQIDAPPAAPPAPGVSSVSGTSRGSGAPGGFGGPALSADVGSDAFLDAATVDVFARREKSRAEKERRQSTGLFGLPVETGAKEGDAFRERWVDPDSDSQTWTPQILPQGLFHHRLR
jgi:hypothetical protein